MFFLSAFSARAATDRFTRPVLFVSRLFVAVLCTALTTACGTDSRMDTNSDVVIAEVAARSVPLDSGAIRQPIPDGINPDMVEWRSDGVLIASTDSLVKTPGYVVDSIFPPEEALRRFQAQSEPVSSLSGGAPSADELMRRYWQTLQSGDSLALRPYVVNEAEFAYLYYPESNEAETGLQPHVSWLLYSSNGGRGLTRALALAGSQSQSVLGTTCMTDRAKVVGNNTLHGPCGIIRDMSARRDTTWIAQHIIERDGVFKLLSFSNEL